MESTWTKCSLYLKKADWFRVVNERGALKELQIMLYVKIDHLIIHFTVQGTDARAVYVRLHLCAAPASPHEPRPRGVASIGRPLVFDFLSSFYLISSPLGYRYPAFIQHFLFH